MYGFLIANAHTHAVHMNHSCATGLPIAIVSNFPERLLARHSRLKDTITIAIRHHQAETATSSVLDRRKGGLTPMCPFGTYNIQKFAGN